MREGEVKEDNGENMKMTKIHYIQVLNCQKIIYTYTRLERAGCSLVEHILESPSGLGVCLVEHLPTMNDGLGSIPRTRGKREKST